MAAHLSTCPECNEAPPCACPWLEEAEAAAAAAKVAAAWQTAVDPDTGAAYWWNAITNESRWAEEDTPVEYLLNDEERKAEDAAAWYSTVDISAERFVSEAALERVILTLKQAKAIDTGNPLKPSDVLEPRLAELRRDIKSMKLYNKPELKTALHRRLRAAGLQSGQVSYKDFTPYDQHHYHGATAVDEMAGWLLGLVSSKCHKVNT